MVPIMCATGDVIPACRAGFCKKQRGEQCRAGPRQSGDEVDAGPHRIGRGLPASCSLAFSGIDHALRRREMIRITGISDQDPPECMIRIERIG
jgi:hypothetical protein